MIEENDHQDYGNGWSNNYLLNFFFFFYRDFVAIAGYNLPVVQKFDISCITLKVIGIKIYLIILNNFR